MRKETAHAQIMAKAMRRSRHSAGAIGFEPPRWDSRIFRCGQCISREYKHEPEDLALASYDPNTDRLRLAVQFKQGRSWNVPLVDEAGNVLQADYRTVRSLWLEVINARYADPIETKCGNHSGKIWVDPGFIVHALTVGSDFPDQPLPLPVDR